MKQKPLILIIGIGNTYRRDDAVGLVVARRLQEENISGVKISEESGEGADLMEAWQGFATVIIIDAVSSGSQPGTIHRLDAHERPIPENFFHYSTHAFSVAEAIELARVLKKLPPRLIVYGIEGQNFAAGEGLSPEVEKAAAEVFKAVREELRSSNVPLKD